MYLQSSESLVEQLDKYKTGLIIILAAEKDFSYQDLKPFLNKASVPVVGAFFPGVMAEGELHYSGFLLVHIDRKFDVQIFDSNEAEQEFAANSVSDGTGFILMDGLADKNQDFLNKLYYQFGNNFQFVGSGAGSLDLVQKPSVFDKNGIYTNKAIVVFIDKNVGIGLQHGYDRLAGPIVATRTVDSKIEELNWENAFDNYSAIVNEDSKVQMTKEDFFTISKGYPLGISRKGHEDIVRDPISVNQDGTLHCIDDVPENAALYVLKGQPSKLIQAAESSCQEALDNVSGTPTNCLLIDCVTRVLYLGDDFSKEIKAATNKINSKYKDVLVEGVLSMGEISTFKDGRLELYNKTFLTGILYDR